MGTTQKTQGAPMANKRGGTKTGTAKAPSKKTFGQGFGYAPMPKTNPGNTCKKG